MDHMDILTENPVIFTIKNIHNKCRGCLEKGKHTHNINGKYIKMFRDSSNLPLKNDVRLPQHMCNSCVNSLKEWERFRDMVIATERQLFDALERSSDSVLNNEAIVDKLCLKEGTSDMEADSDSCGDCDSTFQLSNLPSDDAEDETKVKSDCEEYDSITADSIVITRRADVASDEIQMAVPASPCKREVIADETKTKKKRKIRNFSMESSEGSDSESEMPLADFKQKSSQDNKKIDENTSEDKMNVTVARNKLEPIIPKSIKINSNVIMVQPKLHIDNNHTKIRENIILTLKYSTILPFRYNPLRKYEYRCFYCDHYCSTMRELGAHTESRHAGQVTDNNILSLMRKRAHTHVTADISNMKCRLCHEQPKSIEGLTGHLTDKHKKVYHDIGKEPSVLGFDFSSGKPKCTFCDKLFEYYETISSHMNEHYDGYVCYVCAKTFVTAMKLRSHLRKHKNESTKTNACSKCNSAYETVEELNDHMRTRHLNTELKCNMCPKTFPCRQFKMRNSHMVEEHGPLIKQFKCDVCQNGKVYLTRSSLTKHKVSVHNIGGRRKRLECEICGYSTHSSYTMKEHMDVHNGIKNFECKVCTKRFGKQTTLIVHMRLHTNDKRHVCTVCDTAFVQKNALNFHMKSKHPKE